MLKLEILLTTVFGLLIVFSLIAILIMCIVGCIQGRKLGPRVCHANRRGSSHPQCSMESRLVEEDHDEESGETRTRKLSQAPPPAYRNANQYQSVDLEHIEVVNSTAMYRISAHSEEPKVSSNLPPPCYSSVVSEADSPEILNVHKR